MAINSFPYIAQPTTDIEYSQLFRELQDSGVVGSFGDASLKGTAGSGGLRTSVAAGAAILRGYMFRNTAALEMQHAAADSNPRVDRVVLRLDLSQAISDRIKPVILKGTPSVGTPAVPSLTQTDTGIFEIGLYQTYVGAGAAVFQTSDIIEERTFVGGRVGVWSTETRPTSPRRSRMGLNMSTGLWEYWDNGWKDIAPTVTWASITGKPATFPPTIGTTAVTAAAGNHTHPSYENSLASLAATTNSQATSINSLQSSVSSLNSGKANTTHGHDVTQVSWASEPLHLFINRVLATKAEVSLLRNDATGGISNAQSTANAAWGGLTTKADGWEGDNSSVRHSHGPHSSTYGREAGNNRYATWMDGSLVWGRAVSSLRYKDNVSEWDVDLDALLSIVPKTFHRKVDPEGEMDYGAIAEEVEEIGLKWMLYYDEEGRPDALKDHLLPWALLVLARSQQGQIQDLIERIEILEVRA